jgi:hypothetical protein
VNPTRAELANQTPTNVLSRDELWWRTESVQVAAEFGTEQFEANNKRGSCHGHLDNVDMPS